MKFTNRVKELERLKKFATSRTSALAVIWGRRRVGKTRLLLEWVKKTRGIYFVADQSASSIQRKFFSIALEPALPGFSQVEYPDWHTFFLKLAQEAAQRKWRGPLVIDELPYLIPNSPELPSILQKFIDHDAKKAKLLLALCGSSQTMMQGAILDPSAPLYGRADEIVKLSPISPFYMKQALQLKTWRNALQAYSIWGGIPRYWELAEKAGGALLETIDRLVLDPLGPLSEEPQRVLLEESPPAIHLRSILDAIGLGAHRLSEIASRIGIPVTSLSRPIERLIELELIYRELPFGVEPENSKKTLYKMRDPFLRFWFKTVALRRSLFSQISPQIRSQWVKENLPSLYSITWEEICCQAIPQLSESWGKIYLPASRFWHRQGPEWDVVSQSLDGKELLLGEAKWTEKKPTVSFIHRAIQELKSKGVPPIQRNPKGTIHYVLFIPEKPSRLTLPPDVKIVDAKQVIRALK